MTNEVIPNDRHYFDALYSTVPATPRGSEINILDSSEHSVDLRDTQPFVVWIHSKIDLYYSFVQHGTETDNEFRLFCFAGSTPVSLGGDRIKELYVHRAENTDSGKVRFGISN